MQALVADLQGRLEGLRQEAASAAAGEAAARGETAAAKARAEAAVAKCVQLEKEADGLALDVARLQVGGGVVAVDSPETRGSVSTPQPSAVDVADAWPPYSPLLSPQEKLGRGEVNRSSVRVLHFKMNPEAQVRAGKGCRGAGESREGLPWRR